MRQWAWKLDINGDGVFTIRDVFGWFSWLFFYPGDLAISIILSNPQLAQFFEITPAHYGGMISAMISLIVWPSTIFTLWFYISGAYLSGAYQCYEVENYLTVLKRHPFAKPPLGLYGKSRQEAKRYQEQYRSVATKVLEILEDKELTQEELSKQIGGEQDVLGIVLKGLVLQKRLSKTTLRQRSDEALSGPSFAPLPQPKYRVQRNTES